MRILRAIVEAATDLVPIGGANFFHRCGIGTKPVGDDAARSPVFLHDPLKKCERRSLVPPRCDHSLQYLAFVIDGETPEIAEPAVDLSRTPRPNAIAAGGQPRMCAARLLRISAANIGPNRFHQNRTVPRWLMSIPRSARRSSTLRSDSGI